MKILSIYVDETGDFGPYNSNTPIYGVSFVLCGDLDRCGCYLEKFNRRIKNKKQDDFALHAGPLIRNEGPYVGLNREDRVELFDIGYDLLLESPVKLLTTFARKTETKVTEQEIAKSISRVIFDNLSFFRSFDEINIYYDNGQTQLRGLILGIFSANFLKFNLILAKQNEHPFMQLADICSTLLLLDFKTKEGNLTKSEIEFFGGRRNLKKVYLSSFRKKMLG